MNAPKIIGIAGRKRHGKDTLADVLMEEFRAKQFACAKIGFAYALKEEVAEAVGCSVDYIEQHKDNFRLILQGWGTDFRRNLHGELYWIEQFHRQVAYKSFLPYIIVPDVRFRNEAACIKELGGTLIRVVRTNIPDDHDKHISENDLDGFEFDQEIYHSSIEYLQKAGKTLAKTL